MAKTALRTITLDSQALDRAIEVLGSAVKAFTLSRRERVIYRTLTLSVDLWIVILLTMPWLTMPMAEGGALTASSAWLEVVIVVLGLLVLSNAVAGPLALLLSIPLLRRTFRERAQLNALGVTELTKSLWKASRRTRWLSRIRGAFITVFGGLLAVSAGVVPAMLVSIHPEGVEIGFIAYLAAFYAILAATFLAGQYLRNQREQIDLAANAVQLNSALQALRKQVGADGTVAVSAELVERAAKIESVQIAKDRNEAILQSVAAQTSGYAVKFLEAAARERSALDVEGRIELEDLVARLSTGDVPVERVSASSERADHQAPPNTIQGDRVRVDYAIDRERRGIRITSVKPSAGEVVRASPGASSG